MGISQGNAQAAISRWSIKNLFEDNKLLQAAQSEWKMTNEDQQLLDLLCIKQELDQEVEWFERKLTKLLNTMPKLRKSPVIPNNGGIKKWPKLDQPEQKTSESWVEMKT